MNAMSSKDRMLAALGGQKPDRLPVTTHHVMAYFLDTYLDGISRDAFFDRFGLDPICWAVPHCPDEAIGDYYNPDHRDVDFLGSRLISNDCWHVRWEEVPGQEYQTVRYHFETPGGTLSMTLQSNEHTSWVTEHLIKHKRDIELIGSYVTTPRCDVAEVNRIAADYGDRGLVRGHICTFDLFGQPGTWQDAACLYGIEPLILATFEDPQWVHEFLGILCDRKLRFAESLAGAHYDLLELGGGDASTTVISPAIFETFVAPYDSRIIEAAHHAGQRIVYHTCGGMMPILEDIAAMKPDAMETFTPEAMGGDVDLAEARRRVPDDICMIGGFDQFHFFQDCTVETTKAEVRRCFDAAGRNGGYILCPSDHFFDADLELVQVFADTARECVY